jgi:hypothetical protein
MVTRPSISSTDQLDAAVLAVLQASIDDLGPRGLGSWIGGCCLIEAQATVPPARSDLPPTSSTDRRSACPIIASIVTRTRGSARGIDAEGAAGAAPRQVT